MSPQLQIQGASIVLRGVLNPAICHPSWFASHGLISDREAEAAAVEIVHPDAAVFACDWLQLRVVRNRFQAGTMQESHYEPLRDLVMGVLDLLSHTPLSALGVNRQFHYRLQSAEEQHRVGYKLAPKQQWQGLLQEPGMASLIEQGKRTDGLDGYIRTKVEPSTQVDFGVYIEVNDHYQLAPANHPVPAASGAIEILSRQWNESMQRGLAIAQGVASLGESE